MTDLTAQTVHPDDLQLLRKEQADGTVIFGNGVGLLTPAIHSGYWAYCVPLSEGQAIVGFPKFGTVGIGFAEEEDWNSNLPYVCATDEILLHIWHNRGHVTDSLAVRKAIQMVQEAAYADKGGEPMNQDWKVPTHLIPGQPGNDERFV